MQSVSVNVYECIWIYRRDTFVDKSRATNPQIHKNKIDDGSIMVYVFYKYRGILFLRNVRNLDT